MAEYIRDVPVCEKTEVRRTMKDYMMTTDGVLAEINNVLNQIEDAFGTRNTLDDGRVDGSDKETVLETLSRQTNVTEQILKRIVLLKEVMW